MKTIITLKNNHQIILKVDPCQSLDKDFTIRAWNNEEIIGTLHILSKPDLIVSYMVQVDKGYRRQSLASQMYDWAIKITNKKIIPNEYYNLDAPSSESAIEFWRTRGLILSNGDRFFE